MPKSIKGEWVKYEEEPGKWFSDEDTSYKRLCRDLESHKNTGWDLGRLSDNIYGEFIPCYGTQEGDVYVYYTVNEKSGKRKPKLLLITHLCDDKKMYASVLGIRRKNKRVNTYEPKAKYLEIILDKLKEVNAKDWAIKDTETKLREYRDLLSVAKNGVNTSSDIMTIYRNFTRIDTFLARRLIRGRNVQTDYESLNESLKVEFVKIISCLDAKNLVDLVELTNCSKNTTDLCVVENVSVLRKSVAKKGLECLRFAPLEYRENKDIMLEILRDFDAKSYIHGINYIGEELQMDIDILRALSRTQPFEIRDVFSDLTGRNREKNKLLIEKLKDRRYLLSVIDMHLRNCISNPSYRKEMFVPADILWYFSPDMLENIEDEVLYGPFATPEEERMKSKAANVIKLVRAEINDFRKKHPERYTN